LSTWKCLQYALVCCLGSHSSKWLVGGIYSLPLNYSHWTEGCCFCRRAHRIVRCPGHVSRPLGSVAVDRCIRPLPDNPVHIEQSGATTRERLVAGSLCRLHQIVQCTPDKYCSVSGAPLGRWLTAHFLDFFVVSFGLLFLLSLGLLHIFYVFF
jgi:hypothetical protein